MKDEDIAQVVLYTNITQYIRLHQSGQASFFYSENIFRRSHDRNALGPRNLSDLKQPR